MEETEMFEKDSPEKENDLSLTMGANVATEENEQDKLEEGQTITVFGLNLTLDNSLEKYRNEPFFIEHARRADEKFANCNSNK